MNRIIHFEIHATNPERAIEFYCAVFGWEIAPWQGMADYWIVTTGDAQSGPNGGLLRRRGESPVDGQPVNAFVCTIAVEDVGKAVEAAGRAGGATAVPQMAVPGVGWLAYVKDPDGNIFGVLAEDPSAR